MDGWIDPKNVGTLPPDWMNVPPVFIVGAPRSGTTLLRLMLTAHPNISISSEGAHIYHIARNFSAYANPSDIEHGMRSMHQDLQPWLEKVKFIDIPPVEELLEWVGKSGVSLRSLITFYGTWEARILGKEKLIWWGDNAPYHVHYIPFFDSLFPTSRFLLMIRDPRDACASGRRDLPWAALKTRVSEWEESLADGLLARLTLGSERVKHVKYDELVTAPHEVLQDVSDFLGVEYAEEMLTYYQSAAAVAVAELQHHRNVLRPVFATSVGKYREILTSEEIATIEERLFTSMFHLGYLSYQAYRLALQKKIGFESAAQ